MTQPPVLMTDVFTPGRHPVFTYNPRDDWNIEGAIKRYLKAPGQALVIAGPTKSGKTVLVERLLSQDNALWINGADLRSIDDLWHSVIDFLGLFDQVSFQTQAGDTLSTSVAGKIGIPGLGELSGTIGGGLSGSTSTTLSSSRLLSTVARAALKDINLPVVIDDFHYVDSELQVGLARAIKTVIPNSPVVLIAVPQDAFNAVRAETDLLGRIVQLNIEPWTGAELEYIAVQGFRTLRISDRSGAIAREFANHSLGAPFLMQQLCLEFCLTVGVEERQKSLRSVDLPGDLDGFYRAVASRNVPGVFDALKAGPRTKGQPRLVRTHKDGRKTDVYGAVLYGISRLGPVRSVSTQALSRKIGEYFDDPPRLQNIASALGNMATIAHNQRRGSDAVLDYKDDTVYIADPFLSFYLRFGAWELPKPPDEAI